MSLIHFGILVCLLFAVCLPLLIENIRYHYCPSKWKCSKCDSPLFEANGPRSMLDGRNGFVCEVCEHVMEAPQSKWALFLCVLLAWAVTVGCSAILILDMTPDKVEIINYKATILMYAGVLAGPCTTVYAFQLSKKPMPIRVND